MKKISTSSVRTFLVCSLLAAAGNAQAQTPWTGYDKPTNIIDLNGVKCVSTLLPSTFNVANAWSLPNNNTDDAGNYYNGFSTPLVADLNGDGKPEIIVLGVTQASGATMTAEYGVANRISIIDGNSGAVVKSIPLDTAFRVAYGSYHGSPCHLAIGKAKDSDPYPSIVLTYSGASNDQNSGSVATDWGNNLGRIHCYKFTDANFNYVRPWIKTGTDRFQYDYCVAGHPDASTYNPNTGHTEFRFPIPYIADFDGDGVAELLVYNKIFSLADGSLKATTESLDKANVGRKWWFEDDGSSHECHLGMMSVADLDGDGILEIAAGNRIYKPEFNGDGSWKGTCKKIEFPFAMADATSGTRSYHYGDGFTALGDIDGDGKIEVIVLGRNLDAHVTNRIRVYAWRPTSDGWSTGTGGELVGAMTFKYNTYEGQFGMPFVGDIDYKDITVNGTPSKLPEICFITGAFAGSVTMSVSDLNIHPQSPNLATHTGSTALLKTNDTNWGSEGAFMGHVVGLTYDPTETDPERKLKLSWAMQHDDRSQMTGLTTFDFANAGHPYIVYRDETRLRVIDGSAEEYIPVSYTMSSQPASLPIKLSTPCSSYTGYELPVVADINGDGSADFITISSRVSRNAYGVNDGTWSFVGRLYSFEGEGSAFVDAPGVWNQHVYSPLLVNEDLSIPRKPIPMLTQFQRCDPETMTNCITITPYNGTFLQQPIVRSDHYYPAVLTPDIVITNLIVSQTSQTSSTIKVKFDLENKGEAAISINTPIMFYCNTEDNIATAVAAGASQRLINGTNMTTSIYPNETRTGIEFTITPATSVELRGKYLWVRVTDNGTNFPATGYYECDPANNAMSVPVVVAVNDAASLSWGETQSINILGNDFKTCSNAETTIEINSLSSITPTDAVHGTYAVNNNKQFVYRAPTHVTGTAMTETFSYTITCGDQTSTANITITVSGTDPGVSIYEWTGQDNSDWNDINNWILLPSGTVTTPPSYKSKVIIPEHSQLIGAKRYPELAKSDLANCDTIVFHRGAELGKPVYLTYNAAQVTMGITDNQWYSVAAPLRSLYSGDFIPDGYEGDYNRVDPTKYPVIYQKQYTGSTNSEWSRPYGDLFKEYPLGETMALWADCDEPLNLVGQKRVTFTFPKDSTKYVDYEDDPARPNFGLPTGDYETISSSGRDYKSRFIYEGRLEADTIVNYPIMHGTEADKSTVSIGNPFMSHLDISKLLLLPANADKFEQGFRMHNSHRKDPARHHYYQINTDGSVTSTDTVIEMDFTIPPMQSIILKKADGVNPGTLSMPPSVSVVAHGRHGLRSATEDPLFRVHILQPHNTSKGLADESMSSILIRYKEDASNGYVFNEDMTVINTMPVKETDLAPILYSIIDDETLLAINTIGDLEEPVELGINTIYKGPLKLQFTHVNQFPMAKSMWLEDKLVRDENGQSYKQDLLKNPVYAFSTEVEGDNAYGRFFVYFNHVPTSVMNPESTDYIRISTRENDLTVVSSLSDPIRTVTVTDVQGRTILKESNLNTDYVTLRLPKTVGVYIVKVASQGAQKTKKVMATIGN